ncbi:MAG: methyltransferase domain-containing protein [Sphingobacteriaceae bacterium]|nr:methyltransferase domain-containing protein [Cytophagaceae bacterium]
MLLNATYWEIRYQTHQTGWDLGAVSPPLRAYADQLTDKNLNILIPGAGNGYEAEYLVKMGFTNVTVVDLAPSALAGLRERAGDTPALRLVQGDFFDQTGPYDLVLEQTFFCALDPSLRSAYARKMHELLEPGGKLVGLLFDTDFGAPGPPFGGSAAEYRTLFAPLFHLDVLETAHNSIKPRAGRELFIKFVKSSGPPLKSKIQRS